jgi:uncharacterized protein YdhG (YjbR/CyaY superfamily)
MPRTAFTSVDDYIASQPESAREILNLVRNTIRKAVPKAEEAISYNIPAYKLRGSPVLWFAGWKRHYSFYPASERLHAAFKDQLAPYQVNKGTIRFPLSAPIPIRLIAGIAKFRAQEAAARGKAAGARKKVPGKQEPKGPRATSPFLQ